MPQSLLYIPPQMKACEVLTDAKQTDCVIFNNVNENDEAVKDRCAVYLIGCSALKLIFIAWPVEAFSKK